MAWAVCVDWAHRNLAAAETMGQVTCICSDKTGTLTQNKMTVTRNLYAGQDCPVDNVEDGGGRFPPDWKELVQDCVQVSN